MPTNQDTLQSQIQTLLGKKISQFTLRGKGACNNAYSVETHEGDKYIVKQERDIKEFQPQNDLSVEADVAQRLYKLSLTVAIPHVVFVSESPKMYCYEYIAGDMMREVWASLSEEEKVSICRDLGRFHAEIGKRFTKQMAYESRIKIDESPEVHPEVSQEYNELILSPDVPEEFKMLAKEARLIFEGTMGDVVFQFIHNDSHHENIIVKDNKISGIIDFGNAEWGEIAKEFSRYIRDYPDYFKYIVSSYEQESGNKLSYKRLVSNALLCGFIDIVENYRRGGKDKIQAERAMATYRKLINAVPDNL